MDFREWLVNEKKYSFKVSGDISSRLERVKKILNIESINNGILIKLEESSSFKELNTVIKSQLRKSVKLYIEYKNDN